MTIRAKGCRNGSRLAPRFDCSNWRGRLCRFSDSIMRTGPRGIEWETIEHPEPGDSAPYDRFEDSAEGCYFLSDFLSGSDYSGSLVERANCRDFLEGFGDRDGVHEVYGGHGTCAVAVRLDAIDEEMAAAFDSLEDYPVLDEESLGELEMEAESEAWDCWARGDFVSELESRFDEDGYAELVYVPDPEPVGQGRLFETGERPRPEDLESALVRLFEAAREDANEYWTIETGGGATIDLERVADAVSAEMLAAHFLGMEG